MNRSQRTLGASLDFQGVGVHSGLSARVRVQPARAGSGRVFVVGGEEIPALVEYVVRSERATTLARGEASVSTVEHLLAACAGLGLDNLRIEVEGAEIPILDGSAAPFVEAFRQVGWRDQELPVEPLVLARPVSVASGEALVLALPCSDLVLEYILDYDHPLLGTQQVRFDSHSSFADELAPARTFALWEEVRALLEGGLARGGDLSNALVVKADGFSSPLRLPMEPARHKCLDLLGDLALLGRPLQARVLALRAGHRLHLELARKIRKEYNAHAGRVRDQEKASSSLPIPILGSGPGA